MHACAQVVEMLSYFTYYAPTISDRLWALWPQLQSCLMDWALDYWDNILVSEEWRVRSEE